MFGSVESDGLNNVNGEAGTLGRIPTYFTSGHDSNKLEDPIEVGGFFGSDRTSRVHHSVLNRLEFRSCGDLDSDRDRSGHPLRKRGFLAVGRSAIRVFLADCVSEDRRGVQIEHQCVSVNGSPDTCW